MCRWAVVTFCFGIYSCSGSRLSRRELLICQTLGVVVGRLGERGGSDGF